MGFGRKEKKDLDQQVQGDEYLPRYTEIHTRIQILEEMLDDRMPGQGEPELLWSPQASSLWDRLTVLLLWSECLSPHKTHMLKSYAQCYGIRRWGIWGVIRSQGWSFHEWDQCFYKRDPTELPSAFHHVRTQGEVSHLQYGRGPSQELYHASTLTSREEISR